MLSPASSRRRMKVAIPKDVHHQFLSPIWWGGQNAGLHINLQVPASCCLEPRWVHDKQMVGVVGGRGAGVKRGGRWGSKANLVSRALCRAH